MVHPAGVFDVEERMAGLSKKGDDLERLAAAADFEVSGTRSSGRCRGPIGRKAAARRSTTS